MKITFPSPAHIFKADDPTLADVLQQPAIARERNKAKGKLGLTAADLQQASRELRTTYNDPDTSARQRRASWIRKLEEECVRDQAVLSRTSQGERGKTDAEIPRFEASRILVTNFNLPEDAFLKHLEQNFGDFIRKPVNTQWKRDVLLDATIKTREEWKTDLMAVFAHVAKPDARKAAPQDALESKIDALIGRFEAMLIESGPNRFGRDNGTLHLEGKTFVRAEDMGRGFNGAVVRYVDPRTGEAVAVKSPLFGELSAPEVRARFKEQIRLHRQAMGADLKNESVMPLRAAVIDRHGVPHLVMPEARGGDFRNLVKTLDYLVALQILPFAAKEAIERSVFAQAVHSIDTLHDLGLVHGDIKRANIFLEESGKVRLGDFDLSRLAADPEKSLYARTKTWAAKSRFLKSFVQERDYGALVPKDDDPKKDIYSLQYMLPGSAQFGAAARLRSKTQGDDVTTLLIPNAKAVKDSAYANQKEVDPDQIRALIQTVIRFQLSLSADERKAIDRYAETGGPSEYVERDGGNEEVEAMLRTMREVSNHEQIAQMRALREMADVSGLTSRLKEASRPFEV